MLTARREESDKVDGLESGADDYLTKPFGIREFIARVRALLRRRRTAANASAHQAAVTAGGLHIDPARRLARVDERDVELTAHEFDLLYVLASHPGIVFSRDALVQRVWGSDTHITERSVDTLIKRLRRKIEADPAEPRYISTVWGTGTSSPMPERRWYRSLYWRIALGYIALLAVLLVVQTGLAVWLMDRMWGQASRTPAELAELVARDLSMRLTHDPAFDLERHLREEYGSGYQPFVVVMAGPGVSRIYENRSPVPPNLGRDARRRLDQRFDEPGPGRGGGGGRRSFALYADIVASGSRAGIVAVPAGPPPLSVGLREVAPTLGFVGVALLGAGAALMALVIFRPTHRRLRDLEKAARAVGEGHTEVRANESGGDEVSALASVFNTMAGDLETRAAALADSDRARRQLLADVSHELMTPLSAIRGYVETLGMTELKIDDETRAKYLDIAHQETHKLEAIIGELLDLARLEGGGEKLEREAVLTDDLFRRVADRHRPTLLERSVTLTTAVAEGTPLIYGDADRLEQALQNVAANAIRHTPDGGAVALRAEPAPGDRVRITVADSGPGIPAEHLPRIFDRFYKADASRAGTRIPSGSGLGLSIVRAIVHRHDGEVRAFNGPAGGAVFELLLPVVHPRNSHGSQNPENPGSARRQADVE